MWRGYVDGDEHEAGRIVLQSVLSLVGKVSRRSGHRLKGLKIDCCALNTL
jgi:hypothetical protein